MLRVLLVEERVFNDKLSQSLSIEKHSDATDEKDSVLRLCIELFDPSLELLDAWDSISSYRICDNMSLKIDRNKLFSER